MQHDSLMIYGDRKGFVWNSRDISGGDAIDLLRKVEGKSFPEAVEKRVCISKKTAALRSWKTAVLFCFWVMSVLLSVLFVPFKHL